MDERIAFEEAGRLNRYLLTWRHGAFAAYLVFLFAVVLVVRLVWENSAAVLALLVLAVPIGVVLALVDLRSRRLCALAIEAAKRIESGRKGHLYSDLARPGRARVAAGSVAERWGLAPVYYGYSAALLVTAAVIAWSRFGATSAELAPWVLVVGSLLAIAAAFVIGRSQHAAALHRAAYEEKRREDDAVGQSLEFGASIVESISELQRGAEFRNRDMVARQESRLRDLVLFGQSISVRDVKPEALSAFLGLRGVAAEAAADARSTLESWPSGCAGSRFDVLMKRASETFASVEAAFADTVPASPLERRAGQPDDGKVLRRVTV